MALTFTRALPVAPRQRITSAQLTTLARAFNDRLRAFSFCSWRLIWYWLNLFRQVRNPSGLAFPAQHEFFSIYQFLDPEFHQGATWPVAGPGEPEGANLANPMMQFVFGIADPQGGQGVDAEDTRINDVFKDGDTATLLDLWNRGKAQRGAYEPITGAQNTPAFDVAQSHFRITQPWWSPHGKALGGWLPTPVQLLVSCGATEATGLGVPSYELKWTSLRADVDTTGIHGTITTNPDGTITVTYAGTCLCGTDSVDVGHVIGYAAWPFAWYIAVVTDPGTCEYVIDVFPVNDWIEGPYEGEGRLAHTDGKQLQRALWGFHTDFRGTPLQRTPDTFKIKKIAFDNQEFWTRQYALSPNRAVLSGESVQAIYPQAVWDASGGFVPQGTFGSFGTGSEYPYLTGFVMGGVFASATGLLGRTQVAFYSGSQLLATLDLVPDANGDASAMAWPKTVSTPNPLKIAVAEDARFQAGGTLYAEATEQLEYKPQFWDAALCSRVSASAGGDQFGGGVDGRGLDDSDAVEITENLFRYGCLVNSSGVREQGEWVNDNPVFDAMRRLSRDQCRILGRDLLVSYEVSGGKSILRFKRFPQYPGIDGIELRADAFKDIAPPIDPVTSGNLIEGETYIVRGSGSVSYLGNNYSQDATFTATREKEFGSHGSVDLYVHDGIRHTALKKGFTNEWTMFLEPRVYNPRGSSIWKPEAYSDYFPFCDRCHFYSGTASTQLRRFATYNHSTDLDSDFNPILTPINLQSQMLSPEVPDQFRYAAGANQTGGSAEFYSSCQVYNPPYEIESCVVDDWAEDQVIKITLATRFRSHPNAPASVGTDPLAWSAGEIESLRNGGGSPEDYRTDDNAIREYMLSQTDGNNDCVFRTGDSGTSSAVTGLLDAPFGSCYPVFFFARLIPEPYEDDNNTVQPHDARTLIDQMLHMEIALRSMCEGFVDGRTSQDIICETGLGNLYDYTFENLCFEAFSGKWISPLSLAVRPDDPGGFGPLPNSKMYAELFNRFVSCVNLLDKCRLDLPINFLFRTIETTGSKNVTLVELDGTICTTGGPSKAYGDGLVAPTTGVSSVTSGWSTWSVITAVKDGILFGCPYQIEGHQIDVEYRVEIDPAFINAVPAAIQELINNDNTGFLAVSQTEIVIGKRHIDDATGDACPSPGSPFWCDVDHCYGWSFSSVETEECIPISSGTLVSPPLPAADYGIGRTGAMTVGTFCNTGGASTGAGLTLIAEQNAYVQVPLI
jgi:hypothetical protein